MSLVPWWVLLSSGAAPVLLIGGWLTATALQPADFNPLVQTISSLAAHGASDRWLMTAVLALVGVCYATTAYGLVRVRTAGRIALLIGGIASIAVAFSPEPAGGTSVQHLVSSGMGFTALAIWPSLGVERVRGAPWALRAPAAFGFTAFAAAGALWFLLELHFHGDAGLAERVVTGVQAAWPAVVAGNLRSASQHARQPQRSVEHSAVDG
jgi:hypothetical membrane protein